MIYQLKETSSVELLIGNDYYLDIILPQKVEVQSELYMLGSKLGWILSGRTSEIVENPQNQYADNDPWQGNRQ